jgi:hypothetical protein
MADSDVLMTALRLLFESPPNPVFEAIRYCPREHVLSFRRTGGDDWVNVWLHAGTEDDDFAHVVERNGQPGGTHDVLLWADGNLPESGRPFEFNMPMRRDLVPIEANPMYEGRVHHRAFDLESQ